MPRWRQTYRPVVGHPVGVGYKQLMMSVVTLRKDVGFVVVSLAKEAPGMGWTFWLYIICRPGIDKWPVPRGRNP